MEDIEKGIAGSRKWDWENDGGNTYSAGAVTTNAGEREGRPTMSGTTASGDMTPRRMKSLSRPGGAAGDKGLAAPRVPVSKTETDDEQLSRF